MPRTPTLDLYDEIHGGQVTETIRRLRAEGESHEAIARRLHEMGVEVSRETVRRWVLQAEAA